MKKPEETIEILTKEIESLNSIEARDLVMFYYRINHQHYNITTYEKFNEFLEAFDKNPFLKLFAVHFLPIFLLSRNYSLDIKCFVLPSKL